MSAPQPPKELLNDIAKGDKDLKSVKTHESAALTQSKVLIGVQGKHDLKHVDAPKTDLTEAQKAAFKDKTPDA